MANVLVEKSNLEDIADAIREKTSETLTYKPREMPDAIRRIGGGGSIDEYFEREIRGGGTEEYGWTTMIKKLPKVILGEGITNINSIFKYYNGKAIDLSDFGSTSSVTNMANAFYSCENLETLDVSGFDTARVTRMENMFMKCEKLTTIDVSGFNTSNVSNFSSMFRECSSLTSVDVSGFNTTSATNFKYMFLNCTNLDNNSLNSILLMCSNNTSVSNKTLSNMGINSNQATICQGLSNYQRFIDAGWTTGY